MTKVRIDIKLKEMLFVSRTVKKENDASDVLFVFQNFHFKV